MTRAQSQAIKQLKSLTGRKHVHLIGRGAAGIFAVLRAANILGKDILIPANTCYIVLWAVVASGNYPRLADIDPLTSAVTVKTLRDSYTPATAAIIPCHMYGISAPMNAICAWAKVQHLLVIEDAALATGNSTDGMPCGAWGDASIFSFGLGKIIDTELGGAVLTNDASLSQEIGRILRQLPIWNKQLYGLARAWNELYWAFHRQENMTAPTSRIYADLFQQFHETAAYQIPESYWDDLPEAISGLQENLAHRRKITGIYEQHLQNTNIRLLKLPSENALWRYPVFVDCSIREEVLDALWEQGCHDVTCWYPSLQAMAAAILPNREQPPTPEANRRGAEVINLPLSQNTPESEARKIAGALLDMAGS